MREPARAGLADEVRALLPHAVDVRSSAPRPPATARRARRTRRGRSARDLFAEYLAGQGVDDPRVTRLFARLYDDALAEVGG